MSGPHRDPQGSMWRRWDPHTHVPGTVLSDQYGEVGVGEALDALASRQPRIEVVGVTDYATTQGFREAHSIWQEGAGSEIRLLFPNVELRLDVPTARGSGLNLHLLCAADDVDHLERFLELLEFRYEGSVYRASRSMLIELGRAYKEDRNLEDRAALRAGTNQFKVSFPDLKRRFEQDDWARARCLVGVSGGADGTPGLQTEVGSFDALRREIERFAHVVFSANPNQRAFWLGNGALDRARLVERYGGRKLCLHGSDAHDLGRLGIPDGDRFTWLKGNADFETLQQAVIEPELRAAIGPEPPSDAEAYGRITEVTVSGAGWFSNESLPINPGLVAIIGARGSGKTALADVIAAGAGSTTPFDNDRSFIRRAGALLHDSFVADGWAHDEVTGCDLAEPTRERLTPVRYLSQQFVDKLCSSDGISDELIREIERVIFAAWPVGDRLGTTSFDELLEARLSSARARKAELSETLADKSERIISCRLLRRAVPGKKEDRDQQRKLLENLEKESKELTERIDKRRADRLTTVSRVLQTREQEQQAAALRVQALRGLNDRIAFAREQTFPQFRTRLREEHESAGLDDTEWNAFSIDFAGDVDAIVRAKLGVAERSVSEIAGSRGPGDEASPLDSEDEAALLRRSVAELREERLRLQSLAGIDEQRAKKLTEIADQMARIRTVIANLDREIEEGEGAEEESRRLTEQRNADYAAYFDALLDEERELRTLYAPLEHVMAAAGASVAKLRFTVRRDVDVESWGSSGEELIDLRMEGSFKGRGSIAQAAKDELLEAWRSGGGEAAASRIQSFSTRHSDALRVQARVDRTDDEAYRAWERSVARWLYSTDHVRLSYSLEYDGLDIKRLSPGTRGIVLLLLYLAIDLQETIPLIIDQPEENLDPESVYSELVDLFRKASTRRQVVMVTHNANLVVNTEVDQVVVAHCGRLESGRLPELRYESGGLEDPDIRASVCQILEGGEAAFKDRAKRLRVAV